MLCRVPLDREVWASQAVQEFTCGPIDWQEEIARWLKAPASAGRDSALGCVLAGDADVWVYTERAGDLVGVGSLGASTISVKKDRFPAQIVPCFAVALSFHGRPAADGWPKASRVVFGDLVDEARRRWRAGGPGVLTLVVHPDNEAAIRLYKGFGFDELPKRAGNGYVRMMRRFE